MTEYNLNKPYDLDYVKSRFFGEWRVTGFEIDKRIEPKITKIKIGFGPDGSSFQIIGMGRDDRVFLSATMNPENVEVEDRDYFLYIRDLSERQFSEISFESEEMRLGDGDE